jgi:hypothetical protein
VEPSFNRFDLREVTVGHEGQDVIWDSGASDNVTGNRCALFDFTLLQKPIAVRVATDGPTGFITGTGTLRFPGMRQPTIVVKNVYFL